MELDQALYYMIGNSIIRIIVLDKLGQKNVKGLYDMRPTPSFHAVFASTPQIIEMYKNVSRWILHFISGNQGFLQFGFYAGNGRKNSAAGRAVESNLYGFQLRWLQEIKRQNAYEFYNNADGRLLPALEYQRWMHLSFWFSGKIKLLSYCLKLHLIFEKHSKNPLRFSRKHSFVVEPLKVFWHAGSPGNRLIKCNHQFSKNSKLSRSWTCKSTCQDANSYDSLSVHFI